MNETETESKYDVGVTYRAELVNELGHVVSDVIGCRTVVETKIKKWIPIMITGDTIRLVKIEK